MSDMNHKTKRTPLYSQIRDNVLTNIQEQRWQVNDHLPTEAELADKFHISRLTVKKALGELVEEGYYRIQGKGSFIATTMAGQLELPLHETGTAFGTLKPIVYLTPASKLFVIEYIGRGRGIFDHVWLPAHRQIFGQRARHGKSRADGQRSRRYSRYPDFTSQWGIV